jgi:hypothetical protein
LKNGAGVFVGFDFLRFDRNARVLKSHQAFFASFFAFLKRCFFDKNGKNEVCFRGDVRGQRGIAVRAILLNPPPPGSHFFGWHAGRQAAWHQAAGVVQHHHHRAIAHRKNNVRDNGGIPEYRGLRDFFSQGFVPARRGDGASVASERNYDFGLRFTNCNLRFRIRCDGASVGGEVSMNQHRTVIAGHHILALYGHWGNPHAQTQALEQWNNIAEGITQRLRHRMADQISADHPVISARPYTVLLFTPDEVCTRVRYVQDNPIKEGLPAQSWDCVQTYDNWPLHMHNRKS